MAIAFPEVEDIRLNRSPLDEVICQVRFPPILTISKDRPFGFQEAVRKLLPAYSNEQGFQLHLEDSTEQPRADFKGNIHRFVNETEGDTVVLSMDYFALSTKQYTHWHDFAALLGKITQTVQDI